MRRVNFQLIKYTPYLFVKYQEPRPSVEASSSQRRKEILSSVSIHLDQFE